MESIMADDVIAARSERAVRCAARRWGLALGIGKPHRASTRSSKSSAACVDSASKSILCIGLRDCGRLTVEASEVVMSEQHATLLKKARERLVEDRRTFAKIIAAPFEREKRALQPVTPVNGFMTGRSPAESAAERGQSVAE